MNPDKTPQHLPLPSVPQHGGAGGSPVASARALLLTRLSCLLFLSLLLAVSVSFMSEEVSGAEYLIILMICGGAIPALVLLLTTKAMSVADLRRRALAIAGLYAVFLPCMYLFRDGLLTCLSTTHMGAIALLFGAAEHVLWLPFAVPWLNHHGLPATTPHGRSGGQHQVRR